MDKATVFNLIEKCYAFWPSTKPPLNLEVMVECWHEELEEFETDQVRLAMKSFRRAKFMPSLPEIIYAVEHLGEPTEAEAAAQARAYWYYKDQMQFANGSGYQPKLETFVHPEVRRVMDLIGIEEGWETTFKFAWKDR